MGYSDHKPRASAAFALIGSVTWLGALLMSESRWAAPTLLLAAAAILIAQAAAALEIRGALGSLLLMLALYWAIGYVLRPLVLIMLNPPPRLGDSLSDRRISGDYASAVSEITERAIPAFVLLLVLILALRRFATPKSQANLFPEAIRMEHGLILIGLGWLVRVYALLSDTLSSSAVVTLTFLPTVAAGLIIIGTDPLRKSTLLLLLISEAGWALAAATKAPVMAVLAFGIVRMFLRGGQLRPQVIAAYTAVGLGMFFAVQRVKTELGRLTSTELAESYYPAAIQVVYPVLARFDALQANVDATLAGTYSYLSLSEVLTRLWQALLPQQVVGEKHQLAGAAWGSVLRPQASGPAQAGANLAEGPIAEGWVLAGWPGIAIEIVFLAGVILLIARLFESHKLFLLAFAISMTAQPFLFERGMLGIGEGIGKSLQLAIISSVVLMLLQRSSGRLSSGNLPVTQPTLST